MTWEARRFVLFYVAPLVVAFTCWLWLRLGEDQVDSREVRLLDMLVVGLAALRFVTAVLPASGHMLFLVYSGLTQRVWWYRLLAAVLVIETTGFKLLIWHDARSWLLGGVAGLTAVALHRALAWRHGRDDSQGLSSGGTGSAETEALS